MRVNVLAAVVGAVVGACLTLAIITGRDIALTELRHGTGQL